jgi:hypothetical protein
LWLNRAGACQPCASERGFLVAVSKHPPATSSGGSERGRHASGGSARDSREFGARAVERGLVPASPPRHVEGDSGRRMGLAERTRRSLLKRLGLRMNDLTAIGRETLRLYSETLASLQLIDDWIATHDAIDAEGRPAGVLALRVTYLNTAGRHLRDLRGCIEQLAREDSRYSATELAFQQWIAEDKRATKQRKESELLRSVKFSNSNVQVGD